MLTSDSRYSRGKTQAVIDLLLHHPNLNLDEICAHSGIQRRCVNALIYALEIQQRVIASTYDVARRDQKFRVICVNHTAIPVQNRIHPTVIRKKREASQHRVLQYFSHGIVSCPAPT
jgi:hypothetical protein